MRHVKQNFICLILVGKFQFCTSYLSSLYEYKAERMLNAEVAVVLHWILDINQIAPSFRGIRSQFFTKNFDDALKLPRSKSVKESINNKV